MASLVLCRAETPRNSDAPAQTPLLWLPQETFLVRASALPTPKTSSVACLPFHTQISALQTSIRGFAGTPHFVAFSDLITTLQQQQGEGRNRGIPMSTTENRALPGLKKIAPGKHRTATRRATWRVDKGVSKKHSLRGKLVDVGGPDHIVHRRSTIRLCIGTGIAPPIITKNKRMFKRWSAAYAEIERTRKAISSRNFLMCL